MADRSEQLMLLINDPAAFSRSLNENRCSYRHGSSTRCYFDKEPDSDYCAHHLGVGPLTTTLADAVPSAQAPPRRVRKPRTT